MRKFLILCLVASPLFATTHYIRTDGGTILQCTGTTNAPYTGGTSVQWEGGNHHYLVGDTFVDSNNNLEKVTTPGTSALNYPPDTWNPTTGGTTTDQDGVVIYTNQGPMAAAQACAVNSPMWLATDNKVPLSAFAWTPVSGDTIQFEDLGPYYIGGIYANSGIGTYWLPCLNNGADCDLPPLPDNVNFWGLNKGSCHNATQTALVNPTALKGINGTQWILNIQGTHSPDIECLDMSSVDSCTVEGAQANTITNTSMAAGVATYSWSYPGSGLWPVLGEPITVTGSTNGGGVFNVSGRLITSVTGSGTASGTFTVGGFTGSVASASDTGLANFTGSCRAGQNYAVNGLLFEKAINQGPSNAVLKDLAIHGMASSGILGSKLNTAPTDIFTASTIQSVGNGVAGWNSDGNGCGTSCESQGTMNSSHIIANWNGCIEVLPNGGTIGGNGFNYCVDQGFNGNGDGIVMIASGGTWNWDHVTAIYNAQDAVDLLHASDDGANLPDVHMSFMYAEGNEGQTFKGGGKNVSLINAIGKSNCDVFLTDPGLFPLNPAGWNALIGLTCRANDSMAFAMTEGSTLTIEYVTNIGKQGVSWDFANASCTTNCPIIFKNNTTMGFTNPTSGQNMAGINFAGPDSFTQAGSAASNNSWYHIGASGTCPGNGAETNYVCTDPLFTSESDVNALNTLPTSLSPLRGAGVTISGITTDYNNYPRPSPPGIGALEYQAVSPFTFTTGGSLVFSGSVTF